MADVNPPTPPYVTFITGDDIEDAYHPGSSPEAAVYVLTEAVRRIHPAVSTVYDNEVTAILFGSGIRFVSIVSGEDRLHITAYDGTDSPPRDQTLVSEWKDLTALVGVATRLASFLHPSA